MSVEMKIERHQGILAGLLVAVALPFASLPAVAQPGRQEGDPDLRQLSDSFEGLAERVGRAVVFITASGLRLSRQTGRQGQPAVARERSAGSGVIVDSAGHIITNAHVVDGATRIRVQLAEPVEGLLRGQSILKPQGQSLDARLVGIDRETDLAVLKIDRPAPPHLELGDSDELRPGQLVFAFGSPLGLENSVSIGVVSSAARQLRAEDPVIYVQTDAAVNPGNSGGPLVDTDGHVVGINTMILSQSGGSEGISFAVPSNIVRAVLEQIRASGRMRRGLIGVKAQTITPTLAEGLGLDRNWGVLISDIYGGSPADKAGVQIGDIIYAVEGKLMENARQFDVNIYGRPAGDTLRVEVVRGTELLEIPVEVMERPGDIGPFADMVSVENNLVRELSILAMDVTEQIAALLPGLRGSRGVLVAARVGSEGAVSDLMPGDVIYSLNNRRVATLGDLRIALAGMKPGDAVVLQVERGGELIFLPFEADW
jgi:serine protease Do